MCFAVLTLCLVGLSIVKHVWSGMQLLTCSCSLEEETEAVPPPKRKGCKVKVMKKHDRSAFERAWAKRVAHGEEPPQ